MRVPTCLVPNSMKRILTSTRVPALLWLAVALAATIAPFTGTEHIALVAVGIGLALSLPQEIRIRLTTAAAMAPAALSNAPAWSFVAAGGLLMLLNARPVLATTPHLEGIQRRLEWCRRRNESAHLLWVHTPHVSQAAIAAAMASFRITDKAVVLHGPEGGEEIVAMVDDVNFTREGLTRRLRTHLGETPGIGWATFPEDGVTLDALFSHARTAAVASTIELTPEISPQLSAPVRRKGLRATAPATRVPAQSSNQG